MLKVRLILILFLITATKCLPTDEKENIIRVWPEIGETIDEVRNYYSKRIQNYMDLSQDPCEDFYSYACGNWEKYNPIPDYESMYTQFMVQESKIYDSLHHILLEPIKNVSGELSAEDKAKIFYSSCIDMETINKKGVEPFLKIMNSITSWPVLTKNWSSENFLLSEALAAMSLMDFGILLKTKIRRREDDARKFVIGIEDFKLGLPLSSYTNRDELVQYMKYFIEILILFDVKKTEAIDIAKQSLLFEVEVIKTYVSGSNMVTTIGELDMEYPDFNFTGYFDALFSKKMSRDETVIINNWELFKKTIELYMRTDKKMLANYVFLRFVMNLSDLMDDRFLSAEQKLKKPYFGYKIPDPRSLHCLRKTMSMMNYAMDTIFVRNFFDERSKTLGYEITKNIIDNFKNNLQTLTWIDNETKQKSIDKINGMKVYFGYDNEKFNVESVNKFYKNSFFTNESYFENCIIQYVIRTKMAQSNLVGIVGRSVVVSNAYYVRETNEIIINAGLIQHPFYHEYLPKALLYGSIGVLFGHEITHGLDNNGRTYDMNGNRIEWWTTEAVEKFNEKAKCFVDQYGNYSVAGLRVNGQISLPENIADNGGIRSAYNSYKTWLKSASSDDLAKENLPNINMTHDQLFFMNVAMTFCQTERYEELKLTTNNSQHCPYKVRILASLSNLDEFSEAFNCPVGSQMNPVKKCRLW